MSGDSSDTADSSDADDDIWKQLAERREALEMCVEEDVPFAQRAEKLLDRLNQEGY